MRSAQPNCGTADRGHPHELERPSGERRECRGERHPAACGESGRRGDHLLLGDEHLEVAVRECIAEQFGIRRVTGLGVQYDDVLASPPESDECLAVGQPGWDQLAEFVGRQRELSAPWLVARNHRRRQRRNGRSRMNT